MHLSLRLNPDEEALVRRLVDRPLYNSMGDVLRSGLRLLAMQEQVNTRKLEELRGLIQEGLESERGHELDVDDLLKRARAEVKRRKATA